MVWGKIFGKGPSGGPAVPPQEDPRQQLEGAVADQEERLSAVVAAMAEVAVGRRRLELQIDRHREQAADLDTQARDAMRADRETVARGHLVQQSRLLAQIETLQAHRDQIAGQLAQLSDLRARLNDQVEWLRGEKVAVLASLSAAQAQERAMAALVGGPECAADPAGLLDLARERAEQLATSAAAAAEVAAAAARGRAGVILPPVDGQGADPGRASRNP